MIPKAVAFDMDGLMYDTESLWKKSADILLGRRDLIYTKELCDEIMGRPPEYCYTRMIEYYSLHGTWHDLQNESLEILHTLLHEGFPSMPGLFTLLDFLEKRKIPKAVCTSSPVSVMRDVLSQDNLLPRFDFVITSEEIHYGKPDPEIYRLAVQRFGIPAEEMLVLEDSVAGCEAAVAAGASCFIVRAEHNRHLDFPLATRIVDSLDADEILKLFPE